MPTPPPQGLEQLPSSARLVALLVDGFSPDAFGLGAQWAAALGMASRHPKRYQRLLQRLRQARMASGLSQVKVAAALKADQKYVSRIETGERRIDPIELQELAELYKEPLAFFLEGN